MSMEQAYFQDLPFSGRVRARPTLSRESIHTHPYFPVPSTISFWLTHGKPSKTSECPTLKAFIIFTGGLTWQQGYHRFSLESHRTAHPTTSSCLHVQSSSEGGFKICQFVKHNWDIFMLSLSHSLEFRDMLNSVLGLPCFDVPLWGVDQHTESSCTCPLV